MVAVTSGGSDLDAPAVDTRSDTTGPLPAEAQQASDRRDVPVSDIADIQIGNQPAPVVVGADVGQVPAPVPRAPEPALDIGLLSGHGLERPDDVVADEEGVAAVTVASDEPVPLLFGEVAKRRQ